MDQEKTKTKYYRSLLRNVVLTILFTAMIPTLVVSMFILNEFRSSYQKKVYDHLELLARKHKKISIYVPGRKTDGHSSDGKHQRFEDLSNESTLNRIFVELQRAFDRHSWTWAWSI